ncbi:MAG: AI-2E family transporter [Vicingaceae bacterium]
MNKLRRISVDNIWKVLLIVVLLVHSLINASQVLVPIVFSLFLAIIISPLVSFFEKKNINTIISIIISLLIIITVLGGGIYYVSFQAKNLILDLPDLAEKFNNTIDSIAEKISSINGLSAQEPKELLKQHSDKLMSSGSKILTNALSLTGNFLTFISLVPIYVFFMLLYRKNFKTFLVKLDPEDDDNYVSMVREANIMVHSYIVGLVIVIAIIAILNSIGLYALGLKYAIFMGVLSAVLTVIPYIGIFIGGLLPFLVALITKDSLFYPLAVVGIMGLVQFLEGNFITPNITGSQVNINPLAAIIALIIGANLWGIIGMILAIPMTGILKIIFSHYERLRPYAVLLQSDEEQSKNPEDNVGIYKKFKNLFNKS